MVQGGKYVSGSASVLFDPVIDKAVPVPGGIQNAQAQRKFGKRQPRQNRVLGMLGSADSIEGVGITMPSPSSTRPVSADGMPSLIFSPVAWGAGKLISATGGEQNFFNMPPKTLGNPKPKQHIIKPDTVGGSTQ